MRLKIHLEPVNYKFKLSVNYQYPMSSAVYKVFQNGSKEVSEWLHNSGFTDEKGRRLKLFNFSYLKINNYNLANDSITGMGETSFIFSSPIETQIIKTFINGILKKPIFKITNNKKTTEFNILSIDLQDEIKFTENSSYRLIAPASLSLQQVDDGVKKIKYLKPTDEGYSEQIVRNLKKKYKLLRNADINEEIKIRIRPQNIKSKLITIKEGLPSEIKVKGHLFDFELIAPEEIHKIAYYCGIGEKNSLGFGMIEKIE